MRSLGISNAISRSSAASTSLGFMPTFEFARLRTSLMRLGGNESSSSVCRLSRTFLSVGTSSPQSEQQLIGPVEGGQHRAVEERRGVDDDHVVRLARDLEQPGQLGLGDELGVLRAQRRREHVEARACRVV